MPDAAGVPGRVVVVGSLNVDLITEVARFPRAGETLQGQRFTTGSGGKGANQAVMAARLGAPVSLVARVGDDAFGPDELASVAAAGVDTTQVRPSPGVATGVASILVTADGENAIVVVGGANDTLSLDDVDRAEPLIAAAAIVVCQLEVPLAVTAHALHLARRHGVRTVLTPAPVPAGGLPDHLLTDVDVLCPNESEAAALTGEAVTDLDEAHVRAEQLRARGVGSLVLTLGGRGCLVVDADGALLLPAPDVEVVDTTGAGDALVGALAAHLAAGAPLRTAARRAVHVASVSVTARGTQASYPSASQLPAECALAPPTG